MKTNNMKTKYRVTDGTSADYEIKASSPEEAEEIFRNHIKNHDPKHDVEVSLADWKPNQSGI